MRIWTGIVLAGLAAIPMAAWADTGVVLMSDDFETGGAQGWQSSAEGQVNSNDYKGNKSIKLGHGAAISKAISTTGYTNVKVSVSFYALDMGDHGACFAEFSTDGGNNWDKVYRVGRGGDNGVSVHTGGRSVPEMANQANLTLRIKNTGLVESLCWADNIVVTGDGAPGAAPPRPIAGTTPAAGAPSAPVPGQVIWDPNAH